jgi:hypothetical protein
VQQIPSGERTIGCRDDECHPAPIPALFPATLTLGMDTDAPTQSFSFPETTSINCFDEKEIKKMEPPFPSNDADEAVFVRNTKREIDYVCDGYERYGPVRIEFQNHIALKG